MECYSDPPAFITLKDHKSNFKSSTPCRLINPSKSEMGKVSKHYLEEINKNIARTSNLNQWKNTSSVLNLFNNLPNKDQSHFIKFDIVEFYPSITESLLHRAITYPKTITTITDDVIAIIKNSRKSLSFVTTAPG